MKQLGKTDDGVIGSLVRAYVSRPANPQQACPEFDPDLANAYIERSLTARSRSDYEIHLSECAACRKNVVALVRLAGTEAGAAPAFAGSVPARDGWLSGVGRAFGALTRPQWALAATAMLVLVISVPVFMLRNEADNKAPALPGQAATPAAAVDEPGTQQQSSDVASNAASAAKVVAGDSSSTPTNTKKRPEIDALVSSAPAAQPVAQPSVSESASDRLAKKNDSKSLESETSEEKQKRAQGQLAMAPAAVGGAGPGSQVAKNEAEGARQRQEKDSAQQPREAGRVDEPADKEKTAKAAKPEEAAAPPASPVASSDVAGRSGFRRSPSKLALRDSRDSSGEAVRSTGRKISKKEFWFRNNTWTDKDFDPNKDLPIVTIIRDSNVYMEEINKRPGLKPYLTGFSETERAIIVYKGKVYKLIPQGGEK